MQINVWNWGDSTPTDCGGTQAVSYKILLVCEAESWAEDAVHTFQMNLYPSFQRWGEKIHIVQKMLTSSSSHSDFILIMAGPAGFRDAFEESTKLLESFHIFVSMS